MQTPDPVDWLIAIAALESTAAYSHPPRRAALERMVRHLRELAQPIERKSVSEWRAPLAAAPAVPPAAAWVAPSGLHFCCGQACPGLAYSTSEAAHPASCLGPTQTHQGRTRAELEQPRAKHGACECGTHLEHFTGPNAGGVLCPDCDSEYVEELEELNARDLDGALSIELER